MLTRVGRVTRAGVVLCLLAATGVVAAFTPRHETGPREPAASSSAASSVSSPTLLRGSDPAYQALQQSAPEPQPAGFMDRADRTMGVVNSWIGAVFFFDLIFWNDTQRLPFIVLWLVIAAIYLTLRMGFINVRAFRHAVHVTSGRYTNPIEPGDVSHFEALSTALSATVGLGNIAGVAIAITIGGPGATFWMIVAGLIGMTTKFTECTLGQMYREVRHDGHVLGGPVQYLSKGFAERGMPGTGRFFAVLFALLCIGGSIGAGNAFQVNQSMKRDSGNDSLVRNCALGLRRGHDHPRRDCYRGRNPPHRQCGRQDRPADGDRVHDGGAGRHHREHRSGARSAGGDLHAGLQSGCRVRGIYGRAGHRVSARRVLQ